MWRKTESGVFKLMNAVLTHSFLVLLLSGPRLLALLRYSVQSEAEASHSRQVAHTHVKLQPLIPDWLWADVHLAAGHHLAEQFTAVEEAGLHHQLRRRESSVTSVIMTAKFKYIMFSHIKTIFKLPTETDMWVYCWVYCAKL